MQNSSKTNCSKAEITGKNYKANRTLRVRIIYCHLTTFVILFLTKVVSVGRMAGIKNNTKKMSMKRPWRRNPLRSFFNEFSDRIIYQKPCKINTFGHLRIPWTNIFYEYSLRKSWKKSQCENSLRKSDRNSGRR